MGSGIDWESQYALAQMKSSNFPVGSTQHFVDMVYVLFGRGVSDDVKYHVEKYGYEGCLEPWQVDAMVNELDYEYYDGETLGFRQFVMGYFGGSISELRFAEADADV